MEIAEILKLRQNANGLNKLMNMHVISTRTAAQP